MRSVVRPVVSLCVVVGLLVMSGCAHTILKPRECAAYPKPLDGWDKQILAKYDAQDKAQYIKAQLNSLPFVGDYHVKYPASFRALAIAAAQYDNAWKGLNNAKGEKAESDKAKELAVERKNALLDQSTKLKTAVDPVALKQVNDEIVAMDKTVSTQEGNVALAEAETKRTLNNVKGGFHGLGELSLVKEAVGSYDPEDDARHNLDVAANLYAKLKDGSDKDIIGFGLQYLETMKSDRNRILGELITVAEGFHKALDRKLFFSRGAANIGFDSVIMGTTGIASVTGSESAARALSAFATVLSGVRESVDKELFFQQTSTALLHLMQADVDAKEAILVAGMAKGVDEYSLENGLDDYVDFLLAGDLSCAVKGLDAAAAAKSREENENLKTLKDALQQNRTELQKAKQQKDANKKQKVQDLLNEVNALIGAKTGATPPAAKP